MLNYIPDLNKEGVVYIVSNLEGCLSNSIIFDPCTNFEFRCVFEKDRYEKVEMQIESLMGQPI